MERAVLRWVLVAVAMVCMAMSAGPAGAEEGRLLLRVTRMERTAGIELLAVPKVNPDTLDEVGQSGSHSWVQSPYRIYENEGGKKNPAYFPIPTKTGADHSSTGAIGLIETDPKLMIVAVYFVDTNHDNIKLVPRTMKTISTGKDFLFGDGVGKQITKNSKNDYDIEFGKLVFKGKDGANQEWRFQTLFQNGKAVAVACRAACDARKIYGAIENDEKRRTSAPTVQAVAAAAAPPAAVPVAAAVRSFAVNFLFHSTGYPWPTSAKWAWVVSGCVGPDPTAYKPVVPGKYQVARMETDKDGNACLAIQEWAGSVKCRKMSMPVIGADGEYNTVPVIVDYADFSGTGWKECEKRKIPVIVFNDDSEPPGLMTDADARKVIETLTLRPGGATVYLNAAEPLSIDLEPGYDLAKIVDATAQFRSDSWLEFSKIEVNVAIVGKPIPKIVVRVRSGAVDIKNLRFRLGEGVKTDHGDEKVSRPIEGCDVYLNIPNARKVGRGWSGGPSHRLSVVTNPKDDYRGMYFINLGSSLANLQAGIRFPSKGIENALIQFEFKGAGCSITPERREIKSDELRAAHNKKSLIERIVADPTTPIFAFLFPVSNGFGSDFAKEGLWEAVVEGVNEAATKSPRQAKLAPEQIIVVGAPRLPRVEAAVLNEKSKAEIKGLAIRTEPDDRTIEAQFQMLQAPLESALGDKGGNLEVSTKNAPAIIVVASEGVDRECPAIVDALQPMAYWSSSTKRVFVIAFSKRPEIQDGKGFEVLEPNMTGYCKFGPEGAGRVLIVRTPGAVGTARQISGLRTMIAEQLGHVIARE